MKLRTRFLSATGLTAVFAVTALAMAAAPAVIPTTPEGVTLIEVTRELALSQPEYLWSRPGDAAGRTLFVSNADAPGLAKCVDACAKEFPPLLAAAGAKGFGDWSLVR